VRVIYDNLVDDAAATITGSTAVTGFGATNVQALQPSVKFRTSVVNDGYLDADFNAVREFDTIAVVNSNATRHRNMLRQSNTLNTAPWTKTNISSVTEGDTSEAPVGTVGTSNAVYDNATSGEHKLVQSGVLDPLSGGFSHTPIVLGGFLGFESGQIDEARLRFEANSDYVYADFDLAAGTAGTAQAVDFSSASASITAIASTTTTNLDWYWCEITGTPDSEGAVAYDVTLNLMDGNGAISYSGSTNFLWVCGLQLELGSTIDRSQLVATTSEHGALVRVTESTGDVTGADWMHWAPRDLTRRERSDWHVALASPHYGDNPRIEVYDEYNADAYIEMGRVLIGDALTISGNLTDYQPDVRELGGEARARGGQRYRGVHERTRVAQFTLEYLDRDQAYGEVMQMYRLLGNSTAAYFIADEYETTYPDEFSIYGFIDGDRPIVRQIGLHWQTTFTVAEVL
jgi:hypothetical protein